MPSTIEEGFQKIADQMKANLNQYIADIDASDITQAHKEFKKAILFHDHNSPEFMEAATPYVRELYIEIAEKYYPQELEDKGEALKQ